VAQTPIQRSEVPAEDRWNVAAIYANDEAWEAALAAARQWPDKVSAYEGRLGESEQVLAEALATYFQAGREMEKVWVYAHLRADEDLGNSHYQDMMERARSAFVALMTASSYLSPEILTVDDAALQEWMGRAPLATYRFWLEDQLRAKPYTLSPAEERLMSMASEPLSAFERVFSVLKNVDLAARLPAVQDEEGEQQQLTHSLFIKLLESRDRDLRRRAFEGYYDEYKGNRNTVAAALDGGVKSHVFNARARRYGSALAASLFNDNVEVAVYDALIEAVHAALPAFYRYMELRRRLLGVDRLHLYDVYVPAVPEVDLSYDYDEAVALVAQGIAPLGEEYVRAARQGMTGGWVDRYENVGKRSGAYSSGCYDTMPYILMNYTGTLDSVFTLAHELGHSMHTYLANQAQPYHLADYRILVAEVASTTNEALLNHHLLATLDDPQVRAYLIDRYLDGFRGTLFRQTMFAEFEKVMHGMVEQGQPLTADSLDARYYELVKLYYGDSVAFDATDEPIAYEWARIDHFFYNFYVYKYATGMASAVAIARAILEGQEGALERYLAFLRAGGSDYPLNVLRGAGVDLTTPEPVSSALAEFERLVGELETLVG